MLVIVIVGVFFCVKKARKGRVSEERAGKEKRALLSDDDEDGDESEDEDDRDSREEGDKKNRDGGGTGGESGRAGKAVEDVPVPSEPDPASTATADEAP